MFDSDYYLIDFDGVLTIPDKNHQPKDGLTENDEEFWNFYYDKILDESPNRKVIDFVNSLYNPEDGPLVFIHTARPERFREKSEKWLDEYNVEYDKMIMRKNNDFSLDVEAKEKSLWAIVQFMGKKPLAVFEDRKSLIEMYKSNNVLVFGI